MDYSKIKQVGLKKCNPGEWYIDYAEYEGEVMTEEELNELNEDRDFVHQKTIEFLY